MSPVNAWDQQKVPVGGTKSLGSRCSVMIKAGQGGRRLYSDASAAQLSVFGLIFGGAFVLFGFLYHLLQPSVVANPGLAAFSPPPATRTVPLPRQSDAPALAELPELPASSLNAFAEAAPPEAKPDPKPSAHKRLRPSAADPRRPDVAQQWNFGFANWGNGNRGARGDWTADNHVWRGGPRSAF
jgi:hypothetical protein